MTYSCDVITLLSTPARRAVSRCRRGTSEKKINRQSKKWLGKKDTEKIHHARQSPPRRDVINASIVTPPLVIIIIIINRPSPRAKRRKTKKRKKSGVKKSIQSANWGGKSPSKFLGFHLRHRYYDVMFVYCCLLAA